MRPSFRFLAKYFTPGAPTGLAGLPVHPAPRSTLVYLYSQTLSKLKGIPPTSAYRVATENLTRSRLSVIQSIKPDGFEAWQDRIRAEIKRDGSNLEKAGFKIERAENGDEFIHMKTEVQKEADDVVPGEELENHRLELEPQWTTTQIAEIENKIGGGLLEEIVQVAEGEMKLVDAMIENKSWEPLEEAAPEGQWTYFEKTTSGASSS